MPIGSPGRREVRPYASGGCVPMGLVLVAVLAGSASGLTIQSVSQSAMQVERYDLLTIQFGLSQSYSNPFDTRQIETWFEFTGPSGATRIIPAFYAAEGPGWMIRLCPLEVGAHSGVIRARDSGGAEASHQLAFTGTASTRRGFVRVDPRNSRYLRYDNGEPYRPVGHNLCWSGRDAIHTTYMDRMYQYRENWMRYWMVPYVGQGLEWGGGVEGSAAGLGRYSQNNSRTTDAVMERARARDIQVQLVFDSFNGWNFYLYDNWHENPYNTVFGGPCSLPIHYFTNAEARRLAKQLMRYIVARWGYNTSVLCWEFWNEVDAVGAGGSGSFWDNIPQVIAWHQEMGQYIRSIDPYAHLRTTSFADDGPRNLYRGFWQLLEMDIVQVHQYSASLPDSHIQLINSVREFNKPIIEGEGDHTQLDANGQSIRDLIWAAAVSESGAMSWWWDGWIHPNNLYYHYNALSLWLIGEDWAPLGLQPISVTRLAGPGSTQVYGSGGANQAFLYLLNQQQSVTGLQLRLTQLNPGVYTAGYYSTSTSHLLSTQVINSNGQAPIIDVPGFARDLAVKVRPGGPLLVVEPAALNASVPAGMDSGGVLTVRNGGTGTLDFSVVDTALWMEVTPVSGTAGPEGTTLSVTIQSRLLPPGAYYSSVEVYSPGSVDSPRVIPVNLTIGWFPGDLDGDGDVDLSDYGVLQGCLNGSGLPPAHAGCVGASLDADSDVDIEDVSLLMRCLSGAGVPADPHCLE